jgi:hypothetical protein
VFALDDGLAPPLSPLGPPAGPWGRLQGTEGLAADSLLAWKATAVRHSRRPVQVAVGLSPPLLLTARGPTHADGWRVNACLYVSALTFHMSIPEHPSLAAGFLPLDWQAPCLGVIWVDVARQVIGMLERRAGEDAFRKLVAHLVFAACSQSPKGDGHQLQPGSGVLSKRHCLLGSNDILQCRWSNPTVFMLARLLLHAMHTRLAPRWFCMASPSNRDLSPQMSWPPAGAHACCPPASS